MRPGREHGLKLPFQPPLRPPTPAEASAFLHEQAAGSGLRAYLAQRTLEALHHTAGLLRQAGGELERVLEPPTPPRRRGAGADRRRPRGNGPGA